ncbi:uncharacterized protein EV422DRAFT_265150 [Fimicolochytrium jonesii]|uniref:uncharacterized protein n=1 Tax=Fimicolochytrium jonesii TaxID=1396493 RepID=UPI0022FE3BED|nr:uncharacterized protein EV422DRAFT_265150 [Fimicolochytrium jonesii]KAI8816905.1 hypothetical protein EV422DRAFT_265150 [Fimicolochytrium jonesii]
MKTFYLCIAVALLSASTAVAQPRHRGAPQPIRNMLRPDMRVLPVNTDKDAPPQDDKTGSVKRRDGSGLLPDTSALPGGKGWTSLVRHECGGGFEFAPNLPIGFNIDVPSIERGLSAAVKRAKKRAKCRCPTLSDDDYDLLFDPMTAWLNAVGNTTEPTTQCPGQFPVNLLDFAKAYDFINWPTTCTLAGWRSTSKCTLQQTFPAMSVSIGAAFWKCPNSPLPGFALNCLGENCKTILQPCSKDADCAGGSVACALFPSSTDLAAVLKEQAGFLSDVLKGMSLYEDGEAPGCFNDPADTTITNNLVTNILTYVRSWFPNTGVTDVFGLCGFGSFKKSNPGYGHTTSLFPVGTAPPTCFDSVMNMQVTGKGLVAWDGAIGGGKNAVDAGQTVLEPTLRGVLDRPQTTLTPPKARLAQATCTGEFLFLDGLIRVRFNPTGLPALLSYVQQLAKTQQECRIGKSLTADQFSVRWGMYSLDPWLFAADAGNPGTFKLGAALPGGALDWMTDFKNGIAPTTLALPSTCSFTTWLLTGTCNIEYTGLAELLQLDVKVQGNAQKCSGAIWPSLNLDCVGADCQYLMTAKPCATGSDCGASALCTRVPEGILPNDKDITMPDLLGMSLFTNNASANICNVFDRKFKDGSACGAASVVDQDYDVLAQFVFGGVPNENPKNGRKYCLPNTDFIHGGRITAWAKKQAVVSTDNVVTIPSLGALTSYVDPDPSSSSGTASSSPKQTSSGSSSSSETSSSLLPLGSVCLQSSSCASSNCIGSVCVQPNLKPADADCNKDKECASGVCASSVCASFFSVAAGGQCTIHAQCESGNCVDRFCAARGKVGLNAGCAADGECASGSCYAGACVVPGKKGAVGGSCKAAEECESATCEQGKCALKVAASGKASLVAVLVQVKTGFTANTTATIRTPGNLALTLVPGDNAQVNVTVSPDPPSGVTALAKGLNTYYHFDTDSASFVATLVVSYTDEMLATLGVTPEKLKWARASSSGGAWQEVETKVDTSNKKVIASTSTFSTWTIGASSSAAVMRGVHGWGWCWWACWWGLLGRALFRVWCEGGEL